MKKKKKMIKSSVAKIKSPEVMKPLKDFMSQNQINTSMLGERMGLPQGCQRASGTIQRKVLGNR